MNSSRKPIDVLGDISRTIGTVSPTSPQSKRAPEPEIGDPETMQALIRQQESVIKRQEERIGQLSTKPNSCGIVLRVNPDNATVIVISDGRYLSLFLPIDKKLKPGDCVALNANQQIAEVLTSIHTGLVGSFSRIISDELAEITLAGATRTVYHTSLEKKPEMGDRVLLDNSGAIILLNLGNDDSRYSLEGNPNIEWDDVCGQKTAKAAFREAIISPIEDGEMLKAYGKKPVKGILLVGPAGCGKTMLGKAVATEVARRYGAKISGEGLIYVKGAEILTKFVGDPETAIRSIFHRAMKFWKKHGFPAVIFWDEFDAVGKKRGTGMSSDVNDTIVPTILAEMDGLTESGAILIAATNRPDILDPALVRDGRFDYKIAVERPTRESGRELALKSFRKTLINAASFEGSDALEKAADLLVEKMYSDDYPLWEIYRRKGEEKERLLFSLRHIINGAMIVGVVEKAKSRAIERDKSAKAVLAGDKALLAQWKPTGITKEDILEAVARAHRENRDVNVTDELGDFVHDFKDDVVGIQKLRQVSN
jgi:proteasome-associated ATPase